MTGGAKSRAMLLFGTEEAPEPLRTLRAGPLTVALQAGNLRYLRWHGREVIRGIAFIVRDSRWGTYAPAISDLVVEQAADSFTVVYKAACGGAEGDFAYAASITGNAHGQLSFAAEGGSSRGFTTCRTGFVVLHPLEGVVGHELKVEHASGGRSMTAFPVLISPGQPVFDIRALSHEPWPGTRVTVRMEGDTFEMEDHRNWTDASFKTYVRPLTLGFPYRIEAGEQIAQRVEVEVAGGPASAPVAPEQVAIGLGGEAGPMPRVGLVISERTLPAAVLGAVARLAPSYVAGRIDLRSEAPASALAALSTAATAIGAPLELEAVIAGEAPEAELRTLARAVAAAPVRPESLFVIPARDLRSRPPDTTPLGQADGAAILAAARVLFPGIRLGGGVPIGFTELNRNRPPAGIDFVTHATQAIVHAADDISVMETLEALPHVIASVRAIAGAAVPYRLGPATIGQPAVSAPSSTSRNPEGRRVTVVEDDPRQRGLFAAAFALGYAAVAAAHGVDMLTLGAPAGDVGLFDEGGTSRPLATVFNWLAGAATRPRFAATVNQQDRVATLGYLGPEGPELLVANLGSQPLLIRPEQRFNEVIVLDAFALSLGSEPRVSPFEGVFELDAYAVCKLR